MFEKNGIVILNKPTGMSSFLAVKKVQKILGAKKAGHMGTLDPLGTGVLLIGINKGTKLFDAYLNKTKEYVASFKFGIGTDTLDSEGKIDYRDDVIVTKKDIDKILTKFVGKHEQMPPDYSAKKINGKKACDLKREGKSVELKPKEIEIYKIECLEKIDKNIFSFKILCSSGTYIRSLARDIAKELDTCAVMVSIIRTKCGDFDIKRACTLEELSLGDFEFIEI